MLPHPHDDMGLPLLHITGRNGEIRTHDPMHPMHVRYQAALRSVRTPYTYLNGRSTRIRTLDPLVPNQVRYRTAPHSEKLYVCILIFVDFSIDRSCTTARHLAAEVYLNGRSTRIRTLDPLVPNQVRYRTAPHSEKLYVCILIFVDFSIDRSCTTARHLAAEVYLNGRSTRIRTLDPLVPNQVRYRTAPHSEKLHLTSTASCINLSKQRRPHARSAVLAKPLSRRFTTIQIVKERYFQPGVFPSSRLAVSMHQTKKGAFFRGAFFTGYLSLRTKSSPAILFYPAKRRRPLLAAGATGAEVNEQRT
jgi:hypothetical protein